MKKLSEMTEQEKEIMNEYVDSMVKQFIDSYDRSDERDAKRMGITKKQNIAKFKSFTKGLYLWALE